MASLQTINPKVVEKKNSVIENRLISMLVEKLDDLNFPVCPNGRVGKGMVILVYSEPEKPKEHLVVDSSNGIQPPTEISNEKLLDDFPQRLKCSVVGHALRHWNPKIFGTKMQQYWTFNPTDKVYWRTISKLVSIFRSAHGWD